MLLCLYMHLCERNVKEMLTNGVVVELGLFEVASSFKEIIMVRFKRLQSPLLQPLPICSRDLQLVRAYVTPQAAMTTYH